MKAFLRMLCRPILVSLLCWGAAVAILPGADHAESLALELANTPVRARDINDIYIFRSPSSPEHTVMILTVNPFAAGRFSRIWRRRTRLQSAGAS